MLRFEPKSVVVVDLNENGLAELVCDVRSTEGPNPEALYFGFHDKEIHCFLRQTIIMRTLLRRTKHLFTQPKTSFEAFIVLTKSIWPDKLYISLLYWLKMGKRINWKHPQSFNEKLQWLKIYNRRPEYIKMVDKVKAKEYIATILGKEYIIPTLGVWDDPDKIDFDSLPNRFVLKCNHNSGLGMYICKDKAKMNVANIKEGLCRGIKEDYFLSNREWPYKNVPRRILAEKFIDPIPGEEDLPDYKFFCFNGKVKCFKIDFNRQIDHHANYYDREGRLLPFGEADFPPQPDKVINMPNTITRMIELAEIIAKDQLFIRVDFYDHQGEILFGEMTFFPASGFGKFTSEEWNYKLGEWLSLPTLK